MVKIPPERAGQQEATKGPNVRRWSVHPALEPGGLLGAKSGIASGGDADLSTPDCRRPAIDIHSLTNHDSLPWNSADLVFAGWTSWSRNALLPARGS